MPKLETHVLNGREFYVHRPPLKAGETPGLLILMDELQEINPGEHIPATPAILDKLYGDNELPSQITVFIPAPQDSTARVHEYACNPEFADFLSHALVPYMQAQYGCSAHREDTSIGGTSFSGLAATHAALTHPEIFGQVLAQSGAFWWYEAFDGLNAFDAPDTWGQAAQTQHLTSTQSANQMAWLDSMPSSNPNYPVHFYLDGGTSENQHTPSVGGEAFPGAIHLNQTLQTKLHATHPEHTITAIIRPGTGEHTPDSWQHNKANAFKTLKPNPSEALEETLTEAYKQQVSKIRSDGSDTNSDPNSTPSI